MTSFPQWALVIPSYRCNLACRFCGLSRGVQPAPLRPDVLDRLSDLGVKSFTIGGGEPLAFWPLTRKFLEKGAQLGMKASLVTNGTWLTRLISQGEKFSEVSVVVVSLDGPPAIHDWLREKGTSAAVLDGLKALVQLATGRDLRVCVNMTLCRHNITHIIQTAQEMFDCGVHGFQIQPLVYFGSEFGFAELEHPVESLLPTEQQRPVLRSQLRAYLNFKRDHPGFIANSHLHIELIEKYFYDSRHLHLRCPAGRTAVIIYPGERAAFCGYFGSRFELNELWKPDRLHERLMEVGRLARRCISPCLAFCHHHEFKE